MFQIASILVVAALVFVSGCKPSTAPAPIEQVRETNGESKNRARDPRPTRPPRPEQPPIVGDPDLANAQVAELIQWLGHEDITVRIQAAELFLARGDEALATLIAALDDENYHVRAGAVFALGCFGSQARDAVPRLNELAEHDPWEAVRDAAKFALHDIAGQ